VRHGADGLAQGALVSVNGRPSVVAQAADGSPSCTAAPNPALQIEDLYVSVAGRLVLRGVDLIIPAGEVHVLFGPNASGKSTLLAAVMGLPGYAVTGGTIRFKGERIDGLAPDVIARKGIGLAFQRPPTIRGVRLEAFVRTIGRGRSSTEIAAEASALHLDELLQRELNLGYSGGELKRAEILKLYCQNPELVFLDEPESGVDLENIALISKAINRILHGGNSTAGLIITHTGFILDYVEADWGHVLVDGRIVGSARPRHLFHRIRSEGYGAVGESSSRCRPESGHGG
jgi:Fe-S cluster assembly ATP-binding protein